MEAKNTSKKVKFILCLTALTFLAIGFADYAKAIHHTTISSEPPSTATITPSGNVAFCNSGVLTASPGLSYVWSNGATTQSITVTTSDSYWVTVIDTNGSTSSLPTIVTVNALPNASISASSPTTFCQGGSVTLTASSGSSYLWSNGLTNQSISVNSTGAYSATVTGSNGCSILSNSVNVTVTPSPSPVISASGPLTFCDRDSVILTSTSGASYRWNTGATTQSITVKVSGSYFVAVNGVNGCSSTSSASTVTVNTLPVSSISAGGSTSFCQGNILNLTASNGSSYLWSTGETSQSIVVSTTGNYTVVVTDAIGCSETSSPTQVTVDAMPVIPTITAGGVTTFCQGGSVTLSSSSASAYLWSTGETTQSIVVSSTDNYIVSVSGSNTCSSSSLPFAVTSLALPNAAITQSGLTNLCVGGSVTLTASTGVSYLWSTGETTQSITAVSNSGNYTVTITGSNGCSETSAPTLVHFNPLFVNSSSIVVIKANTVLSASGVLNLSNGTFDNNGTIDIKTCHWTNNAGNGAFTNQNNGTVVFTGGNQYISGTDVTDFYNLTLLGGGVKTLQVNSNVYNELNLNDRELATDVNTVFILNSSVNAVTRTSGFVSSLSGGNMSRATNSNGSYLYPVGSSVGTTRYRPIEITPASGALNTYTVRLANNDADHDSYTRSLNDGTLCSLHADFYHHIDRSSGSDAADLTIYFDPSTDGTLSAIAHWQNNPRWENTGTVNTVSNFGLSGLTANGWNDFSYTPFVLGTSQNSVATITVGGPTTFCQGNTVILTASQGSSYVWSSGETTQSITVSSSGSYSVTISSSNGCPSTSTSSAVHVTVNSIPLVTINPSGQSTLCTGDLLAASAGSAYLWSTGETTQTINANFSGTYWVMAMAGNCTKIDSINIIYLL